MKKPILLFMFVGVTLAISAYAGVSGIRDNGTVSGVPSYQITCSSGSTHIVYYKDGTWYKSGSHMGDKYNSWSVNQVAEYLCNY